MNAQEHSTEGRMGKLFSCFHFQSIHPTSQIHPYISIVITITYARFHFVYTIFAPVFRIIFTSTLHHYALTPPLLATVPRPLLRLTSRHQHRRRDLVGGSRHRGEQLGNAAYSIANDSPSTIRALSKNSSAALALAHPKLEPQHPQQASSGVTSPVPATAVVALSRRSSFVVGAAQQKHLHLFPEHAHVYV